MELNVEDVLKAAGGTLLSGGRDVRLSGICTDSRDVREGSLFVPLIGGRTDAHAFITQALAAGAAATLTSEHKAPETGFADRAWIAVNDTKKALLDIGSYARNRLSVPFIGVTGSVGKTTTREMAAAALGAGYRVFKTPENHNSQVGLPITLTEISPEDEIAVLELGISLPGEMTKIAGIARLDAAVISNITDAHIEALGCRENIRDEKLHIQDGFPQGGILFLNGDDDLLKDVKAKRGCETVYFGTGENCDYRAENITQSGGFPSFTADCRGRRVPVTLAVAGLHNVTNAMAALAVADTYGVDLFAAAEKLGAFRGFKNRQRICEAQGVTYIDDTYNASPASMKAALSVLGSWEGAARKIAVLADMKELGPESARFHEEIGSWLCEHPVDILFTYGELAESIEKAARRGDGAGQYFHFEEGAKEALTDMLKAVIRPGDCVLLKGSNSMKLSETAAALIPEKPDN